MKKKTKLIAPRLVNGDSRVNWGGRLPDDIKYGIKQIAKMENKSVSWMMEEIVIRYFGLKRPRYIRNK